MATLSIVGLPTGTTTAQIGGTFEGGDSGYSYQRFIRVTVTGYDSFDIYSDQSSGGYNTFGQTITGLTPGTTYTWTAVLYVRVTGGWSATSYTDSGEFTTESVIYYGYMSYDLNGAPGYYDAEPGQATSHGGYYAFPMPAAPVYSGYVFQYWQINVSDTVYTRNPGETITLPCYGTTAPGTPYTAVAIWKKASSGGLAKIDGAYYRPVIWDGTQWVPYSATINTDGTAAGWGLTS